MYGKNASLYSKFYSDNLLQPYYTINDIGSIHLKVDGLTVKKNIYAPHFLYFLTFQS